MSTGGQIVGGIVGAVIGFYVGGPLGALQGAALGAGVGIALDPPKGPTVEGPRLQDKGVQISTYGAFMPRVYGTIAGGGNIIQIENNQLRERVRKKESGGKGGGGSTTTRTYTYSATFQLSLCEGPIAAVRRIWCGDKLIYNAGSNNLETIIASNRTASGFKIYLGTDDQMPDPRYEAEYGVGNVSAHRGEAYIAFYDFQLADYSNTLQAAQFKVEVVNVAETPPIIAYDALDSNLSTQNGLIITGNSREIARTQEYTGLTSIPQTVRVHGLSGVREELNQFILGIDNVYAGPVLATGDIDYAFILSTGSVTTSQGVFAGFSYSVFNSGFRVHYDDDKLALICTGGGGSDHVIQLATPDGGFSNSSRTYFAIAMSGAYLYAVTATHIVTFYSDDLTEISAVPFTSAYSLVSDGTFISFDRDLLWILPTANGILQGFDPDTGELVELVDNDAFFVSGSAFSPGQLIDGVVYRQSRTAIGATIQAISIYSVDAGEVNLASIINSEVDRSGLISASDIDTSQLTNPVRGYRVQGGSLRSALEPLQSAYPFDVRQHGYEVEFLPRGQSSIVTIPHDDLGASDGNAPSQILSQSREMDSQLPARTTIKYLDAAREYAIAEQYSERLNTQAINRVDRELPLVLTADEAAGVAEVLNFLPWLERTDAAFVLPPPYRYLEPADVVTLDANTASYEMRLTDTNETSDGRIECKAKLNRAALYDSSATGAEGVSPDGTITLEGESLFVPLDIPVIDETLQNATGFVGAMTGYSSSWPGGILLRSGDGGQTWVDLQAYTGKASIGNARTALPFNSGYLVDDRTIVVDFISGEASSVTRAQILTGSNYAAYGADGRWEIVRFQTATLQADGSYAMSGFIRGDKGTEWATGMHLPADYFILLSDPDNAFMGVPVDLIAVDRLYRAVTVEAGLDSAEDIDFTYQGVNLECLSPAHAVAVRDGSSNLTVTFKRRSRLSSSWWTTGVDGPVGEFSESYETDIMNGSTVVRTIVHSTPTISYSAANQSADFGSPQSSITMRIYQLSAVVGRGYKLEVTL